MKNQFPRRFCATTFALLLASLSAAASAEQPKTMKAVIAYKYGGPDVLKLEELPVPEPQENEILVRVIASGVNPADPLILGGKYAEEFVTHLPLIMGYDVAGVVEKTGARVTKFKPGDRVYAYLLFGGGWAQYSITNENEAALMPATSNFADAAAVPLAALTAWQGLIDAAKLNAGQTVLIHGGSGGVGSFAIQIAKARGARVIATASTANQDFIKQLGADVAIDYTKTKFDDQRENVGVSSRDSDAPPIDRGNSDRPRHRRDEAVRIRHVIGVERTSNREARNHAQFLDSQQDQDRPDIIEKLRGHEQEVKWNSLAPGSQGNTVVSDKHQSLIYCFRQPRLLAEVVGAPFSRFNLSFTGAIPTKRKLKFYLFVPSVLNLWAKFFVGKNDKMLA